MLLQVISVAPLLEDFPLTQVVQQQNKLLRKSYFSCERKTPLMRDSKIVVNRLCTCLICQCYFHDIVG